MQCSCLSRREWTLVPQRGWESIESRTKEIVICYFSLGIVACKKNTQTINNGNYNRMHYCSFASCVSHTEQ